MNHKPCELQRDQPLPHQLVVLVVLLVLTVVEEALLVLTVVEEVLEALLVLTVVEAVVEALFEGQQIVDLIENQM